eukprot:355803-Chlamydomonas_euryale.AAC.7
MPHRPSPTRLPPPCSHSHTPECGTAPATYRLPAHVREVWQDSAGAAWRGRGPLCAEPTQYGRPACCVTLCDGAVRYGGPLHVSWARAWCRGAAWGL